MSMRTLEAIVRPPAHDLARASVLSSRSVAAFYGGGIANEEANRQEPSAMRGEFTVEIPVADSDGTTTGSLHRNLGAIPPEAARSPNSGAMDAFVHDINNLLTVIDGGLRLLGTKTSAGDQARIVQNLHRAVARGASLSRRRLSAAQFDGGLSGTHVCARQIVDIRDLLDRTLRSDVAVETEIDPALCRILADPDELHLALLNLCKNASDAMPRGGKILIRARNAHRGHDVRRVEITVSDEGMGMSQDVLARIFDPYFTTKEPGKGTGLGLDQVRRFIAQSRGALRVDSAPEAGTTVSMFFPCAETPNRSSYQGVPVQIEGA